MKNLVVRNIIIGIFVLLYTWVSIVSTIHVIDFFKLTNPDWLAIALALAFEIGAAASLAAIIILDKTSKPLVWSLFIILTAMQAMGNMYYAYTHAHDYMQWMELFGLNEEEAIYQKRILATVGGAILPLISLGFIKSLVDYIKPAVKSDIPVIQKKTEPVINEVQSSIPETPIEQEVIEDEPAELDEDEFLSKEPVKKSVPSNIRSIWNRKSVDTIKNVEELSKKAETEQKGTAYTDDRAKMIKDILIEKGIEYPEEPIINPDIEIKTEVIKPETNDQSQTFGPPQI